MPRPTRAQLITGAGAAVTTSIAIALGVGAGTPSAPAPAAAPAVATPLAPAAVLASVADLAASSALLEERAIGTSRSVSRQPALQPRTPNVERQLWSTAPLELRTEPRPRAQVTGTFPDDQQIGVTGKRTDGYAEVVVDDTVRWVDAAYLAAQQQPTTGVGARLDTSPCGRSASGGLRPAAQRAMNAVCHAFPQVTTYGGQAPRGEHGGGLAVDIMVRGETGDQIAQFLHRHRGELGLSNIIWAQTIWSAQRGGEGFRPMSNRGSDTANHYDHVHVLVNG